MSFEYKEEYRWLTNICLNITDACNYQCRYCFVAQQPHYMSFQVAKDAVDFIVDNLKHKPDKRGFINYFGGEPTLLWNEIIVPLTNYIKENNFPIDLGMTTNGSLLNQERINFLKDNNINILLSMDGDRETQLYNRPCAVGDSFELTSKNIPAILEAFPNTTFRATIYAPTADKTFENYIYAVKQGFKSVFFIPDVRHTWAKEQIEVLKQELAKIYSFMSWCFNNNLYPVHFSAIDNMFRSVLNHDILALSSNDIDQEINIYRCGLGTGMGSISYDGKIYGCQEQDSQGKNSIFYIGNIYSGINREKHTKLLELYQNNTKRICEDYKLCENCPLRSMCLNDGCPSSSYDLFENFFKETKTLCLWRQWMFNNCTLLMKEMVNKNNPLFKNYLNEQCKYKNFFKEGY